MFSELSQILIFFSYFLILLSSAGLFFVLLFCIRFWTAKKTWLALLFVLLVIFSAYLRLEPKTDTPRVYYDEDWYLDSAKNVLSFDRPCICYDYDQGICNECHTTLKSFGFIAFCAMVFRFIGLDEHLLRTLLGVFSGLIVGIIFLLSYQFMKYIRRYYGFLATHQHEFVTILLSFLSASFVLVYQTHIAFSRSVLPFIPATFFLFVSFLLLLQGYQFSLDKTWLRYRTLFYSVSSVMFLLAVTMRHEYIIFLFVYGFIFLTKNKSSALFGNSRQQLFVRSVFLLFVILMGWGAVSFATDIFFSGESERSLAIDTSHFFFAGKEQNQLFSGNLLLEHLPKNISFFLYSQEHIIISILTFLFFVGVGSGLVLHFVIMKKKLWSSRSLVLNPLVVLLLWSGSLFVFYSLYYPYTLDYLNFRRLVTLYLFFVPSVFSYISMVFFYCVQHRKKFLSMALIIIIAFFVLFALFARKELDRTVPYETTCYVDEDAELETIIENNQDSDALFVTYESYKFSFHNLSTISLYLPPDKVDRTIGHALNQSRMVYYIDMDSSSFIYGLDKIKNTFENEYRITNRRIFGRR
jgi:hypothetical protein